MEVARKERLDRQLTGLRRAALTSMAAVSIALGSCTYDAGSVAGGAGQQGFSIMMRRAETVEGGAKGKQAQAERLPAGLLDSTARLFEYGDAASVALVLGLLDLSKAEKSALKPYAIAKINATLAEDSVSMDDIEGIIGILTIVGLKQEEMGALKPGAELQTARIIDQEKDFLYDGRKRRHLADALVFARIVGIAHDARGDLLNAVYGMVRDGKPLGEIFELVFMNNTLFDGENITPKDLAPLRPSVETLLQKRVNAGGADDIAYGIADEFGLRGELDAMIREFKSKEKREGI